MPEAHTIPMHLVTSHKPQVVQSNKPQASSVKQQAASVKLQAASVKQGWFESFINFQGASGKRQAPSSKHQAASHELLAL